MARPSLALLVVGVAAAGIIYAVHAESKEQRKFMRGGVERDLARRRAKAEADATR